MLHIYDENVTKRLQLQHRHRVIDVRFLTNR